MISWLQKINEPTELQKEQKERNIGCGIDGQNIATLSRMNMASSCKTYLHNSVPDSLELLLPPCEGDNFPNQMKDHWE
jgi:hypothetical protein